MDDLQGNAESFVDDALAKKAKILFRALVGLPDDRARIAFLDEQCAGNGALKKAIIELWVNEEQFSTQNTCPEAPPSQKFPSTITRPELQDATELRPAKPPGQKSRKHWIEVGTIIAEKYDLKQVIGEGGMGLVFRAQQLHPIQRQVAIKLVKSDTTFDLALERFKIEQEALASMKHPNIAQVLDSGTLEDGSPYYVMEYFDGRPITHFCDANQLNIRQRLEIFLGVCNAISHAHECGLIHRDIKPANILVVPMGDKFIPKVIDFGLAKFKSSLSSNKKNLTKLGMILGTLEYMSPEQARANNDMVDSRSDIYALGVLLFELFTGTTPLKKRSFLKQGTQEFLRKRGMGYTPTPSFKLSTSTFLPKVASDRGTPAHVLIQMLQEDLDAVILKALEKAPENRYQTTREMIEDIQKYLSGQAKQRTKTGGAFAWVKDLWQKAGQFLLSEDK